MKELSANRVGILSRLNEKTFADLPAKVCFDSDERIFGGLDQFLFGPDQRSKSFSQETCVKWFLESLVDT